MITYVVYLGDNHIEIFHLGRYIVGYTVGNFVLRRRVSGTVNIYPMITAPNKILNMVILILMYFFTLTHQKQGICCKTIVA